VFNTAAMQRAPVPASAFVEKQFDGHVKIEPCEITEMKEPSYFISPDGNTIYPHGKSKPGQLPVVK
jgi:hypothetical protein